jgi:hypothetical protein
MIMQILGPLLEKWIASCTEEKLTEAAGRLPGREVFASDGEAANALFDEAIASLPRLAFIRRSALRRAKAVMVVNGQLRTSALTVTELEEGRDLVSAVRGE